MNRSLNLLATLLISGFCALTAASPAYATSGVRVEPVPPAQSTPKKFEGVLANKKIVMLLSDRGWQYAGAYAYIPTDAAGALRWIDLEGPKSTNGTVTLVERVNGKETGRFSGMLTKAGFSGVWTSPKGKKFDFSASLSANFPDLKITAQIRPIADNEKIVEHYDIYNGQTLVQTIASNASVIKSLDEFQYEGLDYNFDGYPDLSLPAGDRNRMYLLYDPSKQVYVPAPAALQKIKVTSTSPSTAEIYEEWDDGAESKGMNIFKYVDGKYCLIQEGSVSGPPETAKVSTKKFPVTQCKSK